MTASEADEHGVVDPAALSAAAVGLTPQELRQWLGWCGYLFLDGRILTRTRSAGDHAAGILTVAGMPLTLDTIVERMGNGRNPRTVTNALGDDDRFVRADRATWALQGWQVETYQGIRNEIGRLVRAGEGGVRLADVIESITGRFAVSASSVQAYASGGDFQIIDGVMQLRQHRTAPRKDPAGTRRLYRDGDTWRLRTTVTRDHLWGSGFTVPTAVAGIVGCVQGEVVELESRLGPHPARWTGIQPASGTIRRFLDTLNVHEGQPVFLEFLPGRRFDVRTLPAEPHDLPPLEAAVALTEAIPPTDPADQTRLLAETVGLSPDAKPRQILSVYSRRGDDDIAALLEDAWTRPRTRPAAADDTDTERSTRPVETVAGDGDAEGRHEEGQPHGEWVPVPDGYRSVAWIRADEAEAVSAAYSNSVDVPVGDSATVTGWARYHPATDDAPAKVLLVRIRTNGERSVAWVLDHEATAITQADKRMRTTPVNGPDGRWTGLVEYFTPDSSETQRFHSTTRLFRIRTTGAATEQRAACLEVPSL